MSKPDRDPFQCPLLFSGVHPARHPRARPQSSEQKVVRRCPCTSASQAFRFIALQPMCTCRILLANPLPSPQTTTSADSFRLETVLMFASGCPHLPRRAWQVQRVLDTILAAWIERKCELSHSSLRTAEYLKRQR